MMRRRTYSSYLTGPEGSPISRPISGQLQCQMAQLVRAKNYPCVPAILSFEAKSYMVGEYSDLGSGKFAAALYEDLLYFSEFQKTTKSPYLTFWAVFKDDAPLTEPDFETKLWAELSALSSVENTDVPWDSRFSSNAADDNFCMSLGGDAFFIVGLHSESSRQARKFHWPALLFNLYRQFDDLAAKGTYDSIVATNRSREMKYAGSLNPMVKAYGDVREAIQFSGQENSTGWRCPFQRKTPAQPSH